MKCECHKWDEATSKIVGNAISKHMGFDSMDEWFSHFEEAPSSAVEALKLLCADEDPRIVGETSSLIMVQVTDPDQDILITFVINKDEETIIVEATPDGVFSKNSDPFQERKA